MCTHTDVPSPAPLLMVSEPPTVSRRPTVRRIPYPKGVFEPFYNPKTILIRDPGERLPVIVRSFTANANCDRYLVATTFKAELPNTHMTLNGIGTYNQGLGGLLRHSHLFANVAITLIDGRNYEEIKRPFVNFGANFAASMRLTEDPLTKLDNSMFPDPPAAASANAALREDASTRRREARPGSPRLSQGRLSRSILDLGVVHCGSDANAP